MMIRPLLFLSMCVAITSVTFAGSAKSFVIHTIEDGDTASSIAKMYFKDAEAASELLKFNDLSTEDVLKPGDTIAVPVKLRNDALHEIKKASNEILKARDAMAEEYASELFALAEAQIKSAQKSASNGSYDQAVALSALSIGTAANSLKAANLAAPVQDQAIVRAVSGTVETDGGKKGAWHALKKGDSISTSARIRTGPLSRADIELADGSTFQVQESSGLLLDDMTRDRRDQKRNTRLNVFMGDIIGKIKPRENSNSIFHIKSHGSVTAIRGTRVRLGAMEEEKSRLSVLEGLVTINASGGSVDVPELQGIVVKANKPPEKPEKLPAPPTATGPEDNSKTGVQRISFEWKHTNSKVPVDHYVVEVAADKTFNSIVQTHSTANMPWVSDTLAPGTYFWRLTSVTPSGLIGETGDTLSFSITRNLGVRIAASAEPVKKGKQRIVSPHYTFSSVPTDEETSAISYEYSIDGADFKPMDTALSIGEEGTKSIKVRAVGADGERGQAAKMNVFVDATAPAIAVSVGAPREVSKGARVFDLALSASDETGVQNLEYRVNNGTFTTYEEPIELNSYSDYTVQFRASDLVQNQSGVRTLAFPAEHLPLGKDE